MQTYTEMAGPFSKICFLGSKALKMCKSDNNGRSQILHKSNTFSDENVKEVKFLELGINLFLRVNSIADLLSVHSRSIDAIRSMKYIELNGSIPRK